MSFILETNTEVNSEVDIEYVSSCADALSPQVSLLSVDLIAEVTGTILGSETVGDDGDSSKVRVASFRAVLMA